MGGIIFTVQALEKCVKDKPYLLEFKLKDLEEKIGNYTLSPELFIRLKEALKKAKIIKDGNKNHTDLIKKIEDKITVESKPEI